MLREAFTKMIFGIFIFWLIVTVAFLAAGLFYTLDPDAGDEDYYTESGTHVVVTQSGDTPKMFLFACTPFNLAVLAALLYTWRVRKQAISRFGHG